MQPTARGVTRCCAVNGQSRTLAVLVDLDLIPVLGGHSESEPDRRCVTEDSGWARDVLNVQLNTDNVGDLRFVEHFHFGFPVCATEVELTATPVQRGFSCNASSIWKLLTITVRTCGS
ncbi:hypothetical protein Q31a_25030 [Aureliella helgolandensis]|uniref:Uncharacterized protein n=1 Tax=Aureliella helgolandensis TaxID=2527968 RepID=A0A518G6I3_9BACT|nr:hypothetical protein Q31a_25030 [Aureliella helgolandensis]